MTPHERPEGHEEQRQHNLGPRPSHLDACVDRALECVAKGDSPEAIGAWLKKEIRDFSGEHSRDRRTSTGELHADP